MAYELPQKLYLFKDEEPQDKFLTDYMNIADPMPLKNILITFVIIGVKVLKD